MINYNTSYVAQKIVNFGPVTTKFLDLIPTHPKSSRLHLPKCCYKRNFKPQIIGPTASGGPTLGSVPNF